eukprot:TRINITY_DN6999_c0_g1_i1.p1 TRINITY_DN6999_c0_g1~~TRINITY_DN6999_c0_g1_i1.p1  ORF type:complete len:200 (+),score=45.21 TRINITY_DN6999_c0_g1_i1:82-600(+)
MSSSVFLVPALPPSLDGRLYKDNVDAIIVDEDVQRTEEATVAAVQPDDSAGFDPVRAWREAAATEGAWPVDFGFLLLERERRLSCDRSDDSSASSCGSCRRERAGSDCSTDCGSDDILSCSQDGQDDSTSSDGGVTVSRSGGKRVSERRKRSRSRSRSLRRGRGRGHDEMAM